MMLTNRLKVRRGYDMISSKLRHLSSGYTGRAKVLIVLGVIFALGACDQGDTKAKLLRAMATFDRTYLPVLAETSSGDGDFQATAKYLNSGWNYFRTRFYYADIADTAWKSDLDRIDATVKYASGLMISGGSQSVIHDTLVTIWGILGDIRQRNGIEYYGDLIAALHAPVKVIVETARDKTGADLSNADWVVINKNLPRAVTALAVLQQTALDPALYDFDEGRLAAYNAQLDRQVAAQENLRQALTRANRNIIIVSAEGLLPEFNKLLRIFGRN